MFALIVPFLLVVILCALAYITVTVVRWKNMIPLDVIAIVLACCLLIISCHLLWNIYAPGRDGFVQGTPPTLTELGVASVTEAKAISNGEWNEDFNSIGPKIYMRNLNMYYSVYSSQSREHLLSSPFTWTNVSPNANAQIETKIVFTSNPFQNRGATDFVESVYARGIPLSVNGVGIRGSGPKGMNMGINTDGVAPQKFTLSFLVNFTDNSTTQMDCVVLKTWANNTVNTGINIVLDCMPDDGRSSYKIVPKLTVINASIKLDPINVEKNAFYMLSVTFKPTVEPSKYTATLYMFKVASSPVLMASIPVSVNESLDLTNKSIEIGEVMRQAHPMSLHSFAVHNVDLPFVALQELATYYSSLLQKTAPSALKVYSAVLAERECPLQDTSQCDACGGIDWSNTVSVMLASPECKAAFHESCTQNPSMAACGGCYNANNLASPQCKTFRSLLQGASAYTAADLEKYKSDNELCPCAPSQIPGRVVDFYDRIDAKQMDVEEKKTMPQSFWNWLVKW